MIGRDYFKQKQKRVRRVKRSYSGNKKRYMKLLTLMRQTNYKKLSAHSFKCETHDCDGWSVQYRYKCSNCGYYICIRKQRLGAYPSPRVDGIYEVSKVGHVVKAADINCDGAIVRDILL